MSFENRYSLQLRQPTGLILFGLLAAQCALLAWLLFISPHRATTDRRVVEPCLQDFREHRAQPSLDERCLPQSIKTHWKV